MAKSQTFSVPKMPADPPLLRINSFRGINKAVSPTEISDDESPDMLNMHCSNGEPDTRTGYEKVFPTSLGAGKVNGLYPYRKSDGTKVKLIHHGTKLYTQTGNAQPVQIYASMNNAQSRAFDFGGKKYILDGANYLVYDGTSVSAVTPYVPTLTMGRLPTGGGNLFEDPNLLGAGFKDSFTADGTATVFQLSEKGLDATTVTAVVNGATMTEGAGFTVDRVNGKVTFTAAPANGTDNVIITAYKSALASPDHIKKCTKAVLFGGSNDTRPFLSGNPDFPNRVWRLGVYDATYAPKFGVYQIGSDSEKVMGFAKQYDYLVIEKERSKWNMQYQLVSGIPTFPLKPVNDQVGTLAPNSIQTIENDPVSLDEGGVYKLVSSTVRDERNVVHISEKIDPNLLNEANLANAVSFDNDRKYWLCVNGKVYVLDYARKSELDPHGIWYIYDNIHASCFMELDGQLYFGSDSDGLLYRFKKETEQYPYNDDGAAINAYLYTKEFAFGADERKKLVEKVFYTLQPYEKTSVDVYYITNKKESLKVKETRMDLLDYALIDYATFSYSTSTFPQEASAKIKAKKITHFQLIFKNNKLDERMNISAIGIKFRYQGEVK